MIITSLGPGAGAERCHTKAGSGELRTERHLAEGRDRDKAGGRELLPCGHTGDCVTDVGSGRWHDNSQC